MTYDIDRMRSELNDLIPTGSVDEVTGVSIGESFSSMRESDNRLSERSASTCLIPRDDGNGHAVVDCKRDTASSHAIQEKVLRRIATNTGGGPMVLAFMEADTPNRIARECQGPNGELWYRKPWDIERLPPMLVSTRQASAKHFACNTCDNTTFRPIEDETIAWPSWPMDVILDDLNLGQAQSKFSEQLFLLAYRCLLQHMSQLRGLIRANDHASADHRVSDGYRSILETRQPLNHQILDRLTNLKTKYDRRLVGIASLPMMHRVLPVEPAFPIASTSFTPIKGRHIAITIYPEPWECPDHTIEWRHWMIISAESGHEWLLGPAINAKVEAAMQTMQSDQGSIEWTIGHIANEGSLSIYARPESYSLLSKQHRDATGRIERRIPDAIVVEYYERCIGKALCH